MNAEFPQYRSGAINSYVDAAVPRDYASIVAEINKVDDLMALDALVIRVENQDAIREKLAKQSPIDEGEEVMGDKKEADRIAIERLLSSTFVRGLAEAALKGLAPAGNTMEYYRGLFAERRIIAAEADPLRAIQNRHYNDVRTKE